MKVKFKNNVNSNNGNSSASKDPCFSFGFKKNSGLDEAFISALDSYFKNKDNWVRFDIEPCDIIIFNRFFRNLHCKQIQTHHKKHKTKRMPFGFSRTVLICFEITFYST